MKNFWVCVRRGILYIEKRARQLWREAMCANAPLYFVQAKFKEMLDELRFRGLFVDYEFLLSENLIMIAILPREDVPWINIEMESKSV